MFLKYASKTIRDFYSQISKDHSFTNVKLMRDVIVQDEFTKTDIDPKEWYNIITAKLNMCDRVSKFIEKDTTKKIDFEIKSTRTIFMVITILIFLSLIAFVFMLIAFLKLAKEEQRLRVVMDKYIISSVTDLSGKIIDVSQAFCNISGYTKEELIGSAHNIVRHPDMPKEAFKELWRKIKKGESWSGKVKNLKRDGGFYWVYANIEPLFNSKGEIDSYVSIRLDITENEILMSKIMEEEQKNKFQQEMIHKQSRLAQMGEMLSMIAHQWRQPLNAITAASAVINLKAQRHKLDESTAIELSDKIKEFSIHLSSTIDDFRNFFKSNKIREEVSYKQIVDDVLSICQSSLEDKGIDVIQEINSEDIFLSYKNELKQVVLNLVKNAEDALIENNIEDPCIYIRADKNILSISDNAGGISKDILDKVFDPYFSTKTQKDGTGLGLYMSKMIVEDHCNGSLHVNNDKFGANFEIILGEDND
jgi:PAS domain S-box-containing protein